MVEGLNAIKKALHVRKLVPPVRSRVFEVVGPYEMRERWEEISELPENCFLLETRLTGICKADLRYVSCSRPPEIMSERLPLSVFHEGVARIVEAGDNVSNLAKGTLVVVVPNVPCYLHDPERYPNVYQACRACRPEGAGENLCEDVKFLSSNANGLSRTLLVHLGSCVIPLPPVVPEEIAVLTEPLTVINRAVKQAKANFGMRVAVLGGGFMGYITAAVMSKIVGMPKSDLLVTDIFDFKLDKLKDFATVLNTKEEQMDEELLSSFNVVFECVGEEAAETTINQAISLLSPGGTCLLVGVSEEKVPIKTRAVLEKGLTLKGTTRSAAIDYLEVVEWLTRGDFRRILERIIFPKVFVAEDCESIISACRTAEYSETHGKVLIDWRQKA